MSVRGFAWYLLAMSWWTLFAFCARDMPQMPSPLVRALKGFYIVGLFVRTSSLRECINSKTHIPTTASTIPDKKSVLFIIGDLWAFNSFSSRCRCRRILIAVQVNCPRIFFNSRRGSHLDLKPFKATWTSLCFCLSLLQRRVLAGRPKSFVWCENKKGDQWHLMRLPLWAPFASLIYWFLRISLGSTGLPVGEARLEVPKWFQIGWNVCVASLSNLKVWHKALF